MAKLKTRTKDVRPVLETVVTTAHNGVEKLYGLLTKKIKLGK